MIRYLLLLSVLTLILASSAQTAVVFFDDFNPQQPGWSFISPSSGFLGELNNTVNVSSVTLSLNSAFFDPVATLDFDLLLFRSIDGVNCCTDTFTLTINGSTVFQGALAAGGGGTTSISINNGASFTKIGNNYHFTVVHALNSGPNSYTFGYSALQSLSDEAWGLDDVQILAVPEPSTWLLLVIGVVGMLGMGRRRRRKAA
jgi:hypothetical protein